MLCDIAGVADGVHEGGCGVGGSGGRRGQQRRQLTVCAASRGEGRKPVGWD